jgi:AraC-like DNA-binding protein
MDATIQQLKYETFFPLIFLYKEKRNDRTEPDYHFHNFYEMVFVHNGEGTFFIDNDFHEMRPGDIFIIPGDVIHRAVPSNKLPYTVTVILFESGLIQQPDIGENFQYMSYFEIGIKDKFRLTLQASEKLEYENFLYQMSQENTQRKYGYKHALLHLLHQNIILINRIIINQQPQQVGKSAKIQTWMKDILAYIDGHLNENLSLTHLASQALVSTSHFSRCFKLMTGFHVPEYINTIRMKKALSLLKDEEDPLVLIAETCGFQSTVQFHRIFKQHFDCTPGQYRKTR